MAEPNTADNLRRFISNPFSSNDVSGPRPAQQASEMLAKSFERLQATVDKLAAFIGGRMSGAARPQVINGQVYQSTTAPQTALPNGGGSRLPVPYGNRLPVPYAGGGLPVPYAGGGGMATPPTNGGGWAFGGGMPGGGGPYNSYYYRGPAGALPGGPGIPAPPAVNGGGVSFGGLATAATAIGAYGRGKTSNFVQADYVAQWSTLGQQGSWYQRRNAGLNSMFRTSGMNGVALGSSDLYSGYQTAVTSSGYMTNDPRFRGYTQGISGFAYANPTLGAAGGAAVAQNLGGNSAYYGLRQFGINTIGPGGALASPGNIANQILGRVAGPGGAVTPQQLAAMLAPGRGTLALTMNNMVRQGAISSDSASAMQEYLRRQVAAGTRGINAGQFDTLTQQAASGNKAAISTLRGAGVDTTGLESLRDRAAKARTAQSDLIPGFIDGLKTANDMLGKFSDAIDKLLRKFPALGNAIGGASGFMGQIGPAISGALGAAAGASGLLKFGGSLFGLGRGAVGKIAGGAGRLISRLGAGRLAGRAGGLLGDMAGPVGAAAMFGGDAWHEATSFVHGNWKGGIKAGIGAIHKIFPGIGGPLAGNGGRVGTGGGGPSKVMPANGPITQAFGHNGHPGTDFGAPLGSPIMAAENGTVSYAGAAQGFGNAIVIDHPDGTSTLYGHMYNDGVLVHKGQQVKAGQQIGKVGSNGWSTGPHLHFEVHPSHYLFGGVSQNEDPMGWLKGASNAAGSTVALGQSNATANGASAQSSNTDSVGAVSGINYSEAAQIASGLGSAAALGNAKSGNSGTSSSANGNSVGTSNGNQTSANVPGTLKDWATKGLQLARKPMSWLSDFLQIAMHESGGRNIAQGISDINSQNGNGAFGPWQMIRTTFMANAVPGHTDWHNPIDEAASDANYIASRYGSPANTPGIRSLRNGGQYVGYAVGTWELMKDEIAQLHKGEMVLPKDTADMLRQAVMTGGTNGTGHASIVFSQGSIIVTLGSGTPAEAYAAGKMVVDAITRDTRIKTLMGG